MKTREPRLKLNYKKIISGVSGSAIVAFGVYNVHNVADITEGGILGLNLLLEYWLGISPAFTNAILTVICFLIGWKALGRDFIVYSLFFTGAFSLFYRILEKYTPRLFPQFAYHPWLASLGGVDHSIAFHFQPLCILEPGMDLLFQNGLVRHDGGTAGHFPTSKRVFYGLTLASGLLLATRKRVVVFFHCHLVVDLILFQLVLYVFFYSNCKTH